MVCPKCGGGSTVCKNSRYKEGTVYRRRTCLDCGWKFSTVEVSLEAFSSMKAQLDKLQKIQNIIDE